MRRAIALSCLFLSGAAGLIYELCWIRRASLAFGSTTLALSSVLAVFFLGLALGSQWFGRLSTRLASPLRTYAILEGGIALLALASLPAFDLAEGAYGWIYRAWPGAVAVRIPGRLLLSAVVLLPPALLMGGTLPLFCREFTLARERIARSVGSLYALNTLGAVVGTVLAGFILIPGMGLHFGVGFGAALSAVAGLGAWAVGERPSTARTRGRRDVARARVGPETRPEASTGVAPGSAATPTGPRARRLIGLLAALTGFIALGHEVLWARYLALLVRNTVYTSTVTLGVVLIGIVLGSLVASRWFDRVTRRALALGTLQVTFGLLSMAIVLLPAGLWRGIGDELAMSLVLLLLPAALSGAIFPVLVRLLVDQPAEAGPGTGRIAALNTAGGIAGSLAAGFLLLPVLGLQRSFLLLTGMSLAGGFVAWLVLDRERPRARLAAIAVVLAVWVALPFVFGTHVPADFLAGGRRLLAYREGRESNLAVVQSLGVTYLEIDREWQGQDRKNRQAIAAHVPMLIHPAPRRVLVVGVGAGQAASRFAMYGLDRLDCVDIEPAVFGLIRSHFESAWMDDPRVRIIPDDGREFIAHGRGLYDVISIEIGQLFRSGAGSFYTAEFYRRARARLAPGGVLSQFVPIAFLTPQSVASVVGSFREVFPECALWYNTAELLLLGVNGEAFRLDPRRIEERIAAPRVREDLAFNFWGGHARDLVHPEVFLGGFLCGPRGLETLARGATLLRDDRPLLEYLTSAAGTGGSDERPVIALIGRNLDPTEAVLASPLPADTLAAIAAVRAGNLRDMTAAAFLARIESDAGLPGYDPMALAAAALEADSLNAKANRVMADLLAQSGRWPEAESLYARAVDLRSEDALAQRGLGRALLRRGDRARAAECFTRALSLGIDDEELKRELEAARAGAGAPPRRP